MKESISTRVGRIVAGSFNALLDAFENAAPEMVMEQAIREIDGAVDEVRAELGRTVAQKHLAASRLASEKQRHGELSQKTVFAVAGGRDDLAEAAIAQQMDIEAQLPVLENVIAEADNRVKELEGYISALQAKKREMQEELRNYRASRAASGKAAGDGAAAGSAQNGVETKVERAASAFDRVLEKAAGVAAASGAADRGSTVKLAELEDLARKKRIQERLAAVKAGAGKQ